MTPNSSLHKKIASALCLACAITPAAFGANATWSGSGGDGNWTTGGNWTPNIPGNGSASTNGDIATFNNNLNTAITVDSSRYIGTLQFNAGAGAYTFSSGTFYFNAPGGNGTANAIILDAGVTANQTINSNIVGYRSSAGAGGYGFTNNSTAANLIVNGNISGIGLSTSTFNLAGAGNIQLNGVIANGAGGALGLSKTGSGTLTLTGANSYTGNTSLVGGGLTLDFSAASAPASNIISSGSTLVFGANPTVAASRTLTVTGKTDTANSQTFNGTTLNVGANHLNLSTSGTGSLTVGLGAFATTRTTGFTLDINKGAGTNVTTSVANGATGLLPQPITINGTDFALNDGSGNIVAYTNYTANTATSLSGVADMSSGNTSISGTGTGGVNGLRFNTAADRTITMASTRSLAIDSALLVTSNVGNHTSTITGGTLGGISARDLVIYQNNTAGDLVIDSVITSTNNNGLSVTKSGEGTMILNGTNTYNGATYINEGTVIVTGNAVAGNVQNLTTTGGSTITGVDTANLFVGQRVIGSTVGGTGQGTFIRSISGNSITLSGSTTAGTADVTFSGGGGLGYSNSSTAVQVGTGATLQIGNGGSTGSLISGQGIVNNGTTRFNRSNAQDFSGIISGAGTVVQAGSGSTTLSAANTYTGATLVNSGTLLINTTGSIAATSAVIVNGGTFRYDNASALDRNVTLNGGRFSYNSASNYSGTLSFNSGTVGGSNLSGVTLSIGSGQILAPGNSTGTLSAGATIWANGGTLQFEINDATGTAGSLTAGWDLFNPSSLNISAGTAQFALQITSLDALQNPGDALNFNPGNNYSWLFVDADSSIVGFDSSKFTFSDFFSNPTNGFFSVSQGLGINDDKLYLNYTAVPEPSTYLLVASGLGLLHLLRRRRA